MDPEVLREQLVERVKARALSVRGPITDGTANAHVDILTKTYAATNQDASGAPEESLGCPFGELGLLSTGTSGGKPVVHLTRRQRPDLDIRGLAFAVHDFWSGSARADRTLSLRRMLLDRRGPGTVFRLSEVSLFQLLEDLCAQATQLELSEDGAGGVNLVATGDALLELEEIAWPAH